MKKPVTLLLFLITFSGWSQPCENAFFPFEKGVVFEQTNYDKKGKLQGVTINEVVSVDENKVLVQSKATDKKGKEIASGDYTIICEGDAIKMDFSAFMPDEITNQYGKAEMIMEGDFIVIPNELQVGQSLPDGKGTITIKMGEMSAMSIKMNIVITDRKVEKMETLETPAGTFDTYKITQTSTTSMKMMGMNKTTESSSASWFAKGVGMVKNETYDKNGQLSGYTLMTRFTKN